MEEKKVLIHKLNLTDRKNLNITGVEKVISSNPTCIFVKLSNTDLEIHGSELCINGFIENNIEINGIIDNLKYTKTNKQKDNIFKRIFK